ncbi:hypothetical protein [Lachnoclostridium sp. Marseille-P6806]|uniref:hypothetical protein n=1 Tax=Lachnoclostridium sp. Marseille-P6806 TaxID=2364793 RepID=UPI001031FB76|nr:hypothetical protein [Lachnoclostridium sp. Marseille-P6806]
MMQYDIEHSGVAHDANPPGRGSGRYPFGTGNRQHQHDWDFYSRVQKLKAANPDASESEIAAMLGFYQVDAKGAVIVDRETGAPLGSTSKLRASLQIASNNRKRDEYEEVLWYQTHTNPATGEPYTNSEIGRILGRNESSIRSIIKTGQNGNVNKVTEVADALRKVSEEKGYLDVGKGAELALGISPDGLKTSIEMLKKEGYTIQEARLKQVGSDGTNETIFKVLCPPGSELKDPIYRHMEDIKTVDDPNGIESALTKKGLGTPPKIDPNRIKVVYAEDGGTARDGMIQIRAVRDEHGNLISASPDLSLGNAKYAQVRIAVNGGKECITADNPLGIKYIKGMAVYDENLPSGVDICVNSNKSEKDGIKKALKDIQMNKDGSIASNMFGASVVQTEYTDPKTGERKRSAINLVGSNDGDSHKEGAWGEWSKNLPAQFLAKQSLPLVKQQLKLQIQASEDQYNDILRLNNPVVRKKLLEKFGDECDGAACDLKAAPIGGQKTHVLLPVKSLKDTEIFAPNYPNGTTLALVRFPHAGPFEIPICTVNNNNKEAKAFMKNAKDAVGINQQVASKLSGADFDGDTAIVIPMTRKNASGAFDKVVNIKSAPSLPGLTGFDPTAEYSVKNPRFSGMVGGNGKPTFKYFKSDKDKGKEMGVISNLITDMYAKGCDDPMELSRAVRYSMVVIDAKKHELNYKQAAIDYGIDDLKRKYQANPDGSHGASSLLSRSKSPTEIAARSMASKIDPETGERIYMAPTKTTQADRKRVRVPAPEGYQWFDKSGNPHKSSWMKDENGKDVTKTYDGEIKRGKDGHYYYDKGSGKEVWETVGYKPRTQKIARMDTVKDARELLSANPTEIEQTYAAYANHMKTMGNQARLDSLRVPNLEYSPSAAKEYATEVKSLNDKLTKAKLNAPRERQAQILATSIVNGEFNKRTDLDSDEKRKIKGQALKDARFRCGAQKDRVTFTAKEWEAINKGAISNSKLEDLLNNADMNNVMSLALPKTSRISDAKKSRIVALVNAGYTYEEVASLVDGVSTSSISTIINN